MSCELSVVSRTLFTDMEVDEYPVVLVVGAETETGQVVLRPFAGAETHSETSRASPV